METHLNSLILGAFLLTSVGCSGVDNANGGQTIIVGDASPINEVDASLTDASRGDNGVGDASAAHGDASSINEPPDMMTPIDPEEDSDGDGYTDLQETHAGTDPLDPESVIYQGGWPYNMDKDALEDPGWESPPMEGSRMPRWRAIDQYGDTFDLYDLAGHGRKIVLDVGTWFCMPCKAMAQYFSDGDASVMDEFAWWNPRYNGVLEMINQEEIYWVTVLFSGSAPVSQDDVTRWHDTFPNHHVLVLGDQDLRLREYLSVVAMPHIDVLDENMNFLVYETRGPTRGMRFLADSQ